MADSTSCIEKAREIEAEKEAKKQLEEARLQWQQQTEQQVEVVRSIKLW